LKKPVRISPKSFWKRRRRHTTRHARKEFQDAFVKWDGRMKSNAPIVEITGKRVPLEIRIAFVHRRKRYLMTEEVNIHSAVRVIGNRTFCTDQPRGRCECSFRLSGNNWCYYRTESHCTYLPAIKYAQENVETHAEYKFQCELCSDLGFLYSSKRCGSERSKVFCPRCEKGSELKAVMSDIRDELMAGISQEYKVALALTESTK
jgi:hypothetical protein